MDDYKKYIHISLFIIPSKSQIKNMDVNMQLLVDELKILLEEGTKVVDGSCHVLMDNAWLLRPWILFGYIHHHFLLKKKFLKKSLKKRVK